MTYHIIRTLWKLMSLLPMGVLHLLSDLLYFPLYYVARYRRKVVRKNLVNAFPEKTGKEIEEIEKKFYASFCDYVMETVKLMSISPEKIKKHIRFEGIEEVERLVSQEGRSCVIYMGHTFNWEFVTSLPLHFKDPKIQLGQIYHPLANKAMDRLFLELRNQYGSESISMANAVRACGGNIKLTLLPGVNHNAWEPAMYELGAVEWLLTHSRSDGEGKPA